MSVAAMKARFRAAPGRVFTSVHRGLWGPLPENSAAAIRRASAWDVVEVDVRLDAEGRPFLMHDRTFERTTGQAGDANGAAAEFLSGLRLRQGDGGEGAALTDETVPRLEEAFAALEGSDAIFDLDVKRGQDVDTVAAHVAAIGRQDRATLKIDVLSDADLARLKALEAAHGIMVMAKVALRSDADLALVESLRGADIAALEVSFATLELLARAAGIGGAALRIGVWTMDCIHCCGLSDARALTDPAAVWGAVTEAGVREIMTDRPVELSRFLAG